jgi:hypothetical protein
MGGALSIASGCRIPEVDAVVAFYGIPPPELADPTHAKAPVQAHFGANDTMKGFSDPEVTTFTKHIFLSLPPKSSPPYLAPSISPHVYDNYCSL